jgi:hypothetical protein
MSADAELIRTIKGHFARKTSTQLREILQSKDQERWSPEAFTAAREILAERAYGIADEPLVGEEDPPIPKSGHTVDSLAWTVGLNMLTLPFGVAVVPVNRYRHPIDPVAQDLPIPFGRDRAWLAVNSKETESVAGALALEGAQVATWKDGLATAKERSIFLTPPVADWTLVVGKILFPPSQLQPFLKPLLEHLSKRFDDVQYFCTRSGIELHVWARARKGKLVRGYGWSGEQGRTIWELGDTTIEERNIGLDKVPPPTPHGDDRAGQVQVIPDESLVLQLAFLWSIDPSSLSREYKEPVMGITGRVSWV